MEVIKINTSSKHYQKSLEIREKMLRLPLGLKISNEQIQNEKYQNYHHYCLKNDNKIISALSLKINPSSIQVCQIATLTEYQNKGIGKMILKYAENDLNMKFPNRDFIVYSRIKSIPFYIKSGYYFKNDKSYEIVGIEHRLMKKTAPNSGYAPGGHPSSVDR